MRWISFQGWMGTGLLASALATGCNQAPVQPSYQGHYRTTVTYSPTASATTPGYRSAAPPGEAPLKPVPVVEAPATLAITQTHAEVPENTTSPIVPAINTQVAEAPAEKPVAAAPVPAEGDGPAPTQTVAAPLPKPLPDQVGSPDFGHAEDYSWLAGKLQYCRFNKSWRLRYATVDEEDPFGGSVTIVEDLRVTGLKDGQMVRVEGHLLNPQAKAIAPPYQVNSVQVVDPKE